MLRQTLMKVSIHILVIINRLPSKYIVLCNKVLCIILKNCVLVRIVNFASYIKKEFKISQANALLIKVVYLQYTIAISYRHPEYDKQSKVLCQYHDLKYHK